MCIYIYVYIYTHTHNCQKYQEAKTEDLYAMGSLVLSVSAQALPRKGSSLCLLKCKNEFMVHEAFFFFLDSLSAIATDGSWAEHFKEHYRNRKTGVQGSDGKDGTRSGREKTIFP